MSKGTKKVKSLSLTVTYRVGYGGVEMPKEIYEQLLKAAERLGKLLKVKKYSDGSGRDFYAYASKK